MAYAKLMADEGHFLAYKGLETEYWLRGMLLDGKCDELKFSSWVKSHRNENSYMLQECQFNKRGDKLTAGEWRRVLDEKMLMFRLNHYYTRGASLKEDFECGIQLLTDRICNRMRIGTSEDRIGSEEIILLDHTSTGIVDSIIVAEAIIGNRTPATIVDIEAPGTMARLRATINEVEEIEECRGDETLISKGIGYENSHKATRDHASREGISF